MKEIEERRNYWKNHVDDFFKSEMTQAEYCRERDLKVWQFGYWRRKFEGNGDKSGVQFMELKMELTKTRPQMREAERGFLNLKVRSDYEMEIRAGFDEGELRRLLEVLKEA